MIRQGTYHTQRFGESLREGQHLRSVALVGKVLHAAAGDGGAGAYAERSAAAILKGFSDVCYHHQGWREALCGGGGRGCRDMPSWAFSSFRPSSQTRRPFTTPRVVPAIRVGPSFCSCPFNLRSVVKNVQQRPSFSRRWPLPRPAAVSKLNQAPICVAWFICLLDLPFFRPYLAQAFEQHIPDALAAFERDDIPGKGQEIPPITFIREHRLKPGLVARDKRIMEVGEPTRGLLIGMHRTASPS
jgi:hypothetical protein